jgi:hypothetical protein
LHTPLLEPYQVVSDSATTNNEASLELLGQLGVASLGAFVATLL